MTPEFPGDPGDLPTAEQRLLDEVEATKPGRSSRDQLKLSLARLRNLREKYSERAKRARLERRAGLPVESAETLGAWIQRIESAEHHVRECLAGVQEPGSSAAPGDEVGD